MFKECPLFESDLKSGVTVGLVKDEHSLFLSCQVEAGETKHAITLQRECCCSQ